MFYRMLLVILAALLSACAISAPNSTPTPIANVEPSPEVYPVPTTPPLAPAYPYPQPSTDALEPVATPIIELDSTKGAIRGILLDTEGKPIAGLALFLATIAENPTGPVISFTIESPKGFTDDQGRFVIRNVPAGVYSLAIWTPATNFLIPAPNGEEGSAIRVEVHNGEITELGEIRAKRP